MLPYSMEKVGEQDCDANEQNSLEKGIGERKVRRICVFCGSSSGNRASFSTATVELGRQLVDRKIDLVYGGGSAGEKRVIPRALLSYEISGETIGEVKVVADMHERKSEMSKLSDAFIALPGGYGTMEELLEVIAWSQLGIHNKPVGLLNVDGYYNSLLALFDKGVEEGFIDSSAQHIVVSAETADELMRKMEARRNLGCERVELEQRLTNFARSDSLF